MWAQLEAEIEEAKNAAGDQPPAPDVSEPQQLEALTASVRSLEATVAQLVRGRPRPQPDQTSGADDDVFSRVLAMLGGRLRRFSLAGEDGIAKAELTVTGPGLGPRDVKRVLAEVNKSYVGPVELTVTSDDGVAQHRTQ
jgi:hypothetical protein